MFRNSGAIIIVLKQLYALSSHLWQFCVNKLFTKILHINKVLEHVTSKYQIERKREYDIFGICTVSAA